MSTKKSVKKKSVAKRVSAKARVGKRVAMKKVAKQKTTKKKGVKRAMKNGMYTYHTPLAVVAQNCKIKPPGPPTMKLGDFLKQKGLHSFAKMLAV